MSRQLGSLHRSNSHPTNLNTPITIIPLFAFPPPDFPTSNITSGMNSDTNSNISVLYSISQLNNPNIETEFADSEPSPSNNFQTNSSVFSKPPFQPIPPNNPPPSISTPSYASQVTPTYSSFHSDRSSNSPVIPQISQELDNFITLQQQLLHPNTPTINQISSTVESSNPPTPTPSSAYTASLAQSSTSTESSKKALIELTALLKENSRTIHSQPNQEQPVNISTIHITLTRKIFQQSPYLHFHNIL